MLFGIQPIHIIIVIIVAVLIFGANKLPEMGRSLGRTISEFKQGTKEAAEGFKEEVNNTGSSSAAPVMPVLLTRARDCICAGGKFLHPMRSAQPARSAFLCVLWCETPRKDRLKMC